MFRGDPCLCSEVPAVHATLEIVIIRHAAEIKKQSNSARWAALALGCPVLDYAATSAPFDGGALDLRGAWLLFPGGDATPPPAVPPRRLFVPDGTWQQAKRIAARVPELRGLPKLCLGEAPPERRLRRAPHNGMSTLEAIAASLALCGEPLPAEQLRGLHRAVMARVERARGWLPPP